VELVLKLEAVSASAALAEERRLKKMSRSQKEEFLLAWSETTIGELEDLVYSTQPNRRPAIDKSRRILASLPVKNGRSYSGWAKVIQACTKCGNEKS